MNSLPSSQRDYFDLARRMAAAPFAISNAIRLPLQRLCLFFFGLAFTLTPARAQVTENLDRQPKVVTRTQPVYPFDLLHQGISGSAVVEAVVDTKGDVHVEKVVEATHPEFGLSAASCMSSWKFAPGMKGGRLVNTRFTQNFTFKSPVTPEEIANATVAVADPSAVEPHDVVPGIVSRADPMYPIAVIQDHRSGSVTAEFWIKTDGSVEKVKVIQTTDQRFSGPVAAPLARWKFEPPMRDGRVTRMKVRVVCTFTYAGAVEGVEATR